MTEVVVSSEVAEFIKSLEKSTGEKVVRAIELLKDFGHLLSMPHAKKLTGDLYELRVRGQQEIRIFYIFKSQRAIFIHGFIKKSEQTPDKEIKLALQRLRYLTGIYHI